jgi:hypothetical protein
MKACVAVILSAAAFLGVAAAAPAWATVREDGRAITGWDANTTGALKVVDGQARRPRNEIRVTLNCTGPKRDPGIMDASGAAGDTAATGRDGVPDDVGDGASGPAWDPGENGPGGDSGARGADGDQGANGANGECRPSRAQQSPSGENGAPGAKGDSSYARPPPAVLSEQRTGSGA